MNVVLPMIVKPSIKFKPIDPDKPDPRIASIDRIIERVAKASGVTVGAILGRSRKRDIVWARQDALRAVKDELNISYTKLAKYMGMHHTTIMHDVQVADRRYYMKLAIEKALTGRLNCNLEDWADYPATTVHAQIVAHNKRRKLSLKKIAP